jgi:hypothetical protein
MSQDLGILCYCSKALVEEAEYMAVWSRNLALIGLACHAGKLKFVTVFKAQWRQYHQYQQYFLSIREKPPLVKLYLAFT